MDRAFGGGAPVFSLENLVIYGWIPPQPRGQLCTKVAHQLVVSLHFIVNLGCVPFPRLITPLALLGKAPWSILRTQPPLNPFHDATLFRLNPIRVRTPELSRTSLTRYRPPAARYSLNHSAPKHPRLLGSESIDSSFGCIK